MKSFKQFIIEMAERTPERAIKLVDRITRNQHYPDNQANNILPKPKVPVWGFDADAKFQGKRVSDWYPKIAKHGKLEEVPVKSIKSTQNFVSKEVLKAKIQNKWLKPDQPRHPFIVRHNGEHHLIDGNHQTNKARYLGKATIKARVLNTDSE